MKNHIVIKFLAVLLCTVSLLGAVGGAAGIFALTETDLYNKTVDQLYAERIQSEGQTLAYNTAMFYASRDLGGCPLSLVQELYDHDNGLNPFYYGYALKASEGNVLMNQELPSGDAYRTYTFDVTGQYMYLVATPVGNYSPDWAIAFYEGTVKHIFFVAETKGTMDSLNLRPIEQAKISCAKKLFNEMSTSNVKYHDVDSYQNLLNVMKSL